MKKRIFSLVLCIMMLLTVAACGKQTAADEVVSTSVVTTDVAKGPAKTGLDSAAVDLIIKGLTEANKAAADALKKAAAQKEATKVEAKVEDAKAKETTDTVSDVTKDVTETVEEVVPETPAYTYTDMNATMYAKQSVNVRDLPSTDGNRLGGLTTNQEITVTGKCNETGWYRFEYSGQTAYVSNSYVSDTKVEVAAAAPAATEPAAAQSASNSSNTNNAGKESCPYPLNKIITETTSSGLTVWVLYTTMPGETIWVPLYSGLSIENSSVMTERDSMQSTVFDRAAGNEVYPILGGTDYGFHYAYSAGVKVGTYTEGTVYKYTAGVHAYNGTCPNGTVGCQPGTIN